MAKPRTLINDTYIVTTAPNNLITQCPLQKFPQNPTAAWYLFIMSSTSKSSSDPIDDNIPERLELPSAIERIRSIRGAAEKKIKILHVWIWIRESPKLLVLLILNGWASQLIRNIAAAQHYARRNGFHLVIHGVYYAEEVHRKKVDGAGVWGRLLLDLLNFKREANGDDVIVDADDELWVITTELLRLHEELDCVKDMVGTIEDEEAAVNGKCYQVVTLKEFRVDRTEALKAFEEMMKNYRLLAKSASQVNPGIEVTIEPDKMEERTAVEVRAAELVKHCRDKGTLPGGLGISFRRSAPKDVKDFIEQYSKAQEEMEKGSIHADGAISSILDIVYGNPTLSVSPTGTAADIYMRTSPSTVASMIWIDTTDGESMQLPLYQLCHIIAMLEKKLRELKQGGDIEVNVFYDHHKSRDELCNPQFALLADSIFRGQVSLAIATKSNRVSSHLESFDLLQYICEETQTELLFAQQIGQDDRQIAVRENGRRGRQRNIIEVFNDRMNRSRNKLKYDDRDISIRFLSIGCGTYSKSDKDSVISILRASGLNQAFIDSLDERDESLEEKETMST